MRLILMTLAGLALAPASAHSAPPPVHPECARNKDKISCSCAMNNGGYMKTNPDGSVRWQSKRRKNDPINEAFVRCMKANGRG